MGSFGERLRREREMRGISLDNIAESTKIGTRLLRALEEEHFDLLPGGIFNKGFVRAYAKYLGLNEDEAVADYLIAAGESNLDPKVIAEQNDSRIDRSGGSPGDSRMAGFPIIPVLILLIVIAAGLGGWRIYQDRLKQRQAKADATPAVSVSSPTRAVDTTTTTLASDSGTANAGAGQSPAGAGGTLVSDKPQPTIAPNNLPVGSEPKTPGNQGTSTITGSPPKDNTQGRLLESPKSATTGATPASTTGMVSTSSEQPFEVTVLAKDHAWVSIKSDGKFAVRGIIAPPDVKTVRATGQVVFWTGNAGAVEVSFNGQRIPLEGGPNTAGTLVFNARGVVIPKPSVPTREP